MTENTAYDLRSDFSRTNYRDLSDDYQAAYDWFESFGFSVAVSRLRRYKTCIDELAEHYRQGSLNTAAFKRNFDHHVNALSEATEIMRIRRGLANLYSCGLKEKLKKVLSGNDGRPSPSDFDPSRDTAFELLLASRCQRVGLQVEIGEEADLIVLFDGTQMFVECKRLKSAGNVRKRIKDALRQLHRRYKSASDPLAARGILALSITDLANPEHGLMTGYSPEDVAEKLQRHLDAFIRRQQSLWHYTQDERTIGTFVELSAPSVIESEKLFATCHLVTMNNCCPKGTGDLSLLLGFAKKLAEQGAWG
jgi:plasmid stabilization system protein ParE